MTINFADFNKEQLASIHELATKIDATPEVSEVVEFRGGFLPKQVYVALQRTGGMDNLIETSIAKTHTGARLARYASIISGIIRRNSERLTTEDAKRLFAPDRIDYVAGVTIAYLCEETVSDAYHAWYENCENVPAGLSETEFSLLFVGDILEAVAFGFDEHVQALSAAAQGGHRGTLH